MAFYCGFYNAVKHDRQYDAQDFGEMFDGLINDGVYATIGSAMAVKPGGGMRVIVQTGRAWFNHTWSVNTADYPLDIPDSDLLLPRTDAIILEIDKRVSVRNNSLKIIQGYPATDPLPPDLIRDAGQSIYQYPLAYITVPANAVTIDKSMIDNRIGREPTPFVTGIVQSISIDDAWMQWEGQFENWFNNLKAQLSENVVTDLLLKLEKKVNIDDKATDSQILSGSANKWVDAKGLKTYIDSGPKPVGEVFSGFFEETDAIMPCDGRILKRSDYPELWDKMGRGSTIPFDSLTMQHSSNKNMYSHILYDVIDKDNYAYAYHDPGNVANNANDGIVIWYNGSQRIVLFTTIQSALSLHVSPGIDNLNGLYHWGGYYYLTMNGSVYRNQSYVNRFMVAKIDPYSLVVTAVNFSNGDVVSSATQVVKYQYSNEYFSIDTNTNTFYAVFCGVENHSYLFILSVNGSNANVREITTQYDVQVANSQVVHATCVGKHFYYASIGGYFCIVNMASGAIKTLSSSESVIGSFWRDFLYISSNEDTGSVKCARDKYVSVVYGMILSPTETPEDPKNAVNVIGPVYTTAVGSRTGTINEFWKTPLYFMEDPSVPGNATIENTMISTMITNRMRLLPYNKTIKTISITPSVLRQGLSFAMVGIKIYQDTRLTYIPLVLTNSDTLYTLDLTPSRIVIPNMLTLGTKDEYIPTDTTQGYDFQKGIQSIPISNTYGIGWYIRVK